MKVINLYGGPGAGKSSTAAGVFHQMKMNHMSVELVTEYAKDLVYGDRIENMMDQQEYIFAKQNQRLHRLRDKVDFVITDSPTLLSNIYVDDSWCCAAPFKTLVSCTYNTYDNVNVYLERPNEFQEYGRVHNKEESETIDSSVIDLLHTHNIDFITLPVDEHVVHNLFQLILHK